MLVEMLVASTVAWLVDPLADLWVDLKVDWSVEWSGVKLVDPSAEMSVALLAASWVVLLDG